MRPGICVIVAILAGASAAAIGQEMPPTPKPGPEHDIFKEDAGTWDATVEVFMEPGAQPMVSKGTETNTIGCGGLCLITDFKSQMFHGHGVGTWDPAKKKYVGSWTDSLSTGLAVSESTWDPTTRTFTGWTEGPDMTGKVIRSRSTVEYKADGTRVSTMYSPGPDGKDTVSMRISYKRRSS